MVNSNTPLLLKRKTLNIFWLTLRFFFKHHVALMTKMKHFWTEIYPINKYTKPFQF